MDPNIKSIMDELDSDIFRNLTPQQQLQKFNLHSKYTKDYLEEWKIAIFSRMQKQAEDKDPNYHKLKFTESDAAILLIEVIGKLSHLTIDNYRACSIKKVINDAWLTVAQNKTVNWLNKNKHRKSFFQFKKASFSFVHPENRETFNTLAQSKLKIDNLTNNQVIKLVAQYAYEAVYMKLLIEENKNKEMDIIKLKRELEIKNSIIESIKNNNLTPIQKDWQEKAIQLKAAGYKVNEIVKSTGKSRTTISTFLNKKTTIDAINKLTK